MEAEYEVGKARLDELVKWWQAHPGNRNEASTRFHLIDTLFFECLGWAKDDMIPEESHGGEYADYTFLAPRRILIVEAKRESDYFELPSGKTKLEYALPSLIRDYPNLKKAIEQVAGYCQSRGIPYATVSNGHQIVAFIATRSDGSPPLEGKALVFPSLPFMSSNFLQLWQALSKPGIEEKLLQRKLIGTSIQQLPARLSDSIAGYPGNKGRNTFQTDLQVVSELVLEDVARAPDLEDKFLEECYSQSGALSQYSLVSKTILQTRYAALFESDAPGPTTLPAAPKSGISPELLAESLSRRPILLIGDVGVGKSTFIRHLIRVDAAPLFENAITLNLDLGTQATLTADLRSFVPNEIERQMREHFGVDIDERNFVRGVYHGELERFSRGIYADLRTTNPGLYMEKEIQFLEEKLRNREDHVKHALEHLAKGWKKQIVIFLDNADQRDDNTQQATFLIAQEIAERWPAAVFVALRPETFYRSTRSGALSGYHPKAFTISPPRIDRVIEKRLGFGLKICDGEIPVQALTKNTIVNLNSLSSVIVAFMTSLRYNNDLSECIDNIANGNVRLALDLVKGFFGSGHVNTEKIVEIWDETHSYVVPVHEFIRAVIYGDAKYYDPDRSVLANVFDVSHSDSREHFALPILIALLGNSAKAIEGFVETHIVYEELQGLGFTPEQIDAVVVRAHRGKLVETSARRIPVPGQVMPEALRATSVGLYHVQRLCQMFSYVDAMIVDTPVFDPLVRASIKDAQRIEDRLARCEIFQHYLDDQWNHMRGKGTAFDWDKVSQALEAEIVRIRSRV
jgi:hypothetical protein